MIISMTAILTLKSITGISTMLGHLILVLKCPSLLHASCLDYLVRLLKNENNRKFK